MPPKEPKSKKGDKKKSKNAEPVEETPQVVGPPQYCGRLLSRLEVLHTDPAGVDGYDLGCRKVDSCSDILCPIYQSPGPAVCSDSIPCPIPVNPCVQSWTRDRCLKQQQELLEETAEAEPPVLPPANVTEQEYTRKVDLLQESIDKGILPDQSLLYNLYHFTPEQLQELQEAFLYCARYMYPKPTALDKQPDSPVEEKPDTSASDKKSKKDKKDGKKSPTKASPEGSKGKGGKASGKAGKGAKSAAKDVEVESPEKSLGAPILGLNRCGFARCLRAIDQTPSEYEIGVMLRMAGPEPINLTSFLYSVDRWTLRQEEDMKDDLWQAFKVFDMHDNCRISIYKLKEVLECLGEPLIAEDLQELLSLSEPPDRDGMIDIAPIVHRLLRGPPFCGRPSACLPPGGPGGDQGKTPGENEKEEQNSSDKFKKQKKSKKK